MGWKNVKVHYGITHYVMVADKGICIGSCYVHDLLVVTNSDEPRDLRDSVDRTETKIGCNLSLWRPRYLGQGEPFDGIVKAMMDDPATLRRLIETPDTFSASVPVYTYDYDGNIIDKLCEEPGWPNVTHDGDMMYENTFSTDRDQVIKWAQRNMEAGRENAALDIEQQEEELARTRERLSRFEAALVKLRAA